MTNFIYLSPNFPENHWNFVHHLKLNGINTLGIGDCEYNNLAQDLRNSLNEYYKVNSLENYDDVYRAVAYFAHKYGRIDWLESNNEYWLERDASLRNDFNIKSGIYNYNLFDSNSILTNVLDDNLVVLDVKFDNVLPFNFISLYSIFPT